MNKIFTILLTLILLMTLTVACTDDAPSDVVSDSEQPISTDIANGRYRGTYGDGGEMQVSIQFDVENNLLSNVSFRHLQYKGHNFRNLSEGEQFYPVFAQHLQIAEYLDGKPLSAIEDLYNPGDIIDDVDGFSGASLRANKVASAIQDALNRDIYSPRNGYSAQLPSYPDGRYRGTYGDSGEMQVSIQFNVANSMISNVSFRHLQYKGHNFRNLSEGEQFYPVFAQHLQIAEYLDGKPLAAIYDLHSPADLIDDVDGFSGASVRANKVFSAIMDGLNRGIYTPSNGYSAQLPAYPDGRYRGTYGDSGEMQVSIQFNVANNMISNISFRHLQYKGHNFRNLSEGEQFYPVFAQHLQIAEYLDGKPLSAIYDLHSPADLIDDVDSFSGASVRANKVFSAIMDGLNRGLY